MKSRVLIFTLLIYSYSFSQSLIGIGAGIGTMNLNRGGKGDTSGKITQQQDYIPKINLSFSWIATEHFSPELNIDLTKQTLSDNVEYTYRSQGTGYSSDSHHYKYNITTARLSFLLNYHAKIKKMKIYLGGGPYFGFHFGTFTGYDTYSGGGWTIVNGNYVYTYNNDTTSRNGDYNKFFASFVFCSSIDIPITDQLFISPSIMLRLGSYKFTYAYSPYISREGYFSISLKYQLGRKLEGNQ